MSLFIKIHLVNACNVYTHFPLTGGKTELWRVYRIYPDSHDYKVTKPVSKSRSDQL